MANKDNQRAFDVAVRQIKKQGGRAYVNGACRYRAENGAKCAVGALIADEHYRPAFEGQSINSPLKGCEIFEAVKLSGYDVSFELLDDMQSAHDGYYDLQTVLACFKRVADCHGLDPAVLDEAV